MILLLFLACTGRAPDPVDAALAPWPDDPDALLASCDKEPFPELATTCRVQAAARYAMRGDDAGATKACAPLPAGTWAEECHFRVGEELGRSGQTLAALKHCKAAGWFGRNCLTHTGWHLPPDPKLDSRASPDALESAAKDLMSQVDQTLAGAGDGLEGEGHDIVLSRFGYNAYVGTGRADPAPAHIEGPVGNALRTGFGIEAARLLPNASVEAVLAVWKGTAPVPTGQPLPPEERMGRYTNPIPAPQEEGLPRMPIYGGGMRLVGATLEEDMTIAALEGLFWNASTDAAVFLPWVDDARPAVRRTAARLLRLCPSKTIDLEATLKQIAATSTDEDVRWHANDGLQYRTWEDRPRRR